MPYDFYNMSPYNINYDNLNSFMNSLPNFMSNKSVQKNYINKWIEELHICDNAIITQMQNTEDVTKYLLAKQTEPEVFQIDTFLGSNKILMHFRISPLLQLLEHNKDSIVIEEWNIDSFINDSNIKWTEESDLGRSSIETPIIFAPYPIGIYKILVVDGNHRLSYLIKHNSKTVNVIPLGAKTYIDSNLFACGFDKFFYTMIIEIQAAIEGVEQGMTDNEILNKSFLNDGVFKYYV